MRDCDRCPVAITVKVRVMIGAAIIDIVGRGHGINSECHAGAVAPDIIPGDAALTRAIGHTGAAAVSAGAP